MKKSHKNLLEETIEILKANGKTPNDVRWVGDGKKFTTWKNFEAISNFRYYAGYGGNEIAGSLLICGDDFWLERGEYDGSEWWEFRTTPEIPLEKSTLISVKNEDYRDSIEWEN